MAATLAMLSRNLVRIFLGLCPLLALAAALVPIYIDELVYKIKLGRFFFEGGQQMTLYPQCPDTFAVDVALPFVPGAAIVALLWQDLSLLGMRLSGFVFLGIWLYSIWHIIRREIPDRRCRNDVLIIVVALQLLGVSAFTLMVSRPEQFLTAALCFFCAYPLIGAPAIDRRTQIGAPIHVCLYALVLSLACFSHGSIIYYVPVIAVSAWLTFGTTSSLLAIGVGITGAAMAGYSAIVFTQALFHCNDPAIVASMVQLLELRGLLSDPVGTLTTMAKLAMTSAYRISGQMVFADSYQSTWLPSTAMFAFNPAMWIINVAIRLVWYGALVAGIWVTIRTAINLATRWSVMPGALLASALTVSLLMNAIHLKGINFTSVQLMMPVLVLIAVFSMAPLVNRLGSELLDIARPIALTLSCVSMVMALAALAPPLIRNAVSGKIFLDNQHHSYSVWNGRMRDRLTRELMQKCDISPADVKMLVLDDVGYYLLRKTRRPIFATYVDPNMMGAGLKGRLKTFLAGIGSSGILVKYNYLPWELQSIAHVSGEVACVTAAALKAQ